MKISVIKGEVLGVSVYRGYAKLCDLAAISKADIYNQKNNPHGTQRNLSPQHAKEAYNYVKNRELAFWPEVFLSARNKKVVKYFPSKSKKEIGNLVIDVDAIENADTIAISRVDGNHRLHYADGKSRKYPAIHKVVSFCLAYDLSVDEEIILFKDINDNQKAMNTSHLDNIEVRLTTKRKLKQEKPDLYIAQKLGRESKSPFFKRVYEGGKKLENYDVPLRSLRTGISYMFSRSNQLPPLDDADAQYRVIRNYFTAVKKWQPKAWSNPKDYLLLRGAGFWSICFIGSVVIDRCLLQSKFNAEDMLEILKSGKNWDWSNNSKFKGYSGRGGALQISNMVTKEFKDPSRLSSKELYKKIMESD